MLAEVAESIGIGLDGGSPAIDALTAAFAYRQFFLVLDNFEQIKVQLATYPSCRPLSGRVGPSDEPRSVEDQDEDWSPSDDSQYPRRMPDCRGEVACSPAIRGPRQGRATGLSLNDPRDVDAVVELCRRLNGIPLAVELAWDEVPSLRRGHLGMPHSVRASPRPAYWCGAMPGRPRRPRSRCRTSRVVINIALPH